MIGLYNEGALDGSIEDAIDDFRARRDRAFAAGDANDVLRAIGRMASLPLSAADDLTANEEGWDNQELWRAFRRLVENEGIRPQGFFPECLMVCGSVLEQEIKAVFARKGIPLPATDEGVSSMNTRIEAAHRFHWLSTDGRWDAMEVWHRRNKTTHHDPDLVKQARETVGLTITVLQELARVR